MNSYLWMLLATWMLLWQWNILFCHNLDILFPILQSVLGELECKIIKKWKLIFLVLPCFSIDWKVYCELFLSNIDAIIKVKETIFPKIWCGVFDSAICFSWAWVADYQNIESILWIICGNMDATINVKTAMFLQFGSGVFISAIAF